MSRAHDGRDWTDIEIRAKVTKEDGRRVLVVDGTEWSTSGPTLDAVLADVEEMLRVNVFAHDKRGHAERELAKLGYTGPKPRLIHFIVRLYPGTEDALPRGWDFRKDVELELVS